MVVKVGVFPLKGRKAGDPYLAVLPLSEALETRWNFSACFSTYLPKPPVDASLGCRLKKEHLPAIRQAGDDIEALVLTLDFDLPKNPDATKRFWRDLNGSYSEMLDKLEVGIQNQSWGLLSRPAAYYPTPSGLRLVYVYDRPVSVEHHEVIIAWAVEKARPLAEHLGLYSDPSCVDWTRVFRMPYVLREDGIDTRQDPQVFVLPRWENVLRVDDLPGPGDAFWQEAAKASLRNAAVVSPTRPRSPKPEMVPTLDPEFAQLARRRLQHHPDSIVKDALAGQAFASEGHRNNAITKLVGMALSGLRPTPTTNCPKPQEPVAGISLEQVYALFYPSVMQFEPDDGKGWDEIFWEQLSRFWDRDTDKIEAQKALDEEAEERVLGDLERIVEMFRTKYAEEVPEEPLEAATWARKLLIVGQGARGDHYVLRADGNYTGPVRSQSLVNAIEQNRLDEIIPTMIPTKAGDLREKTYAELTRGHIRLVEQVTMEYTEGKGALVKGSELAGWRLALEGWKIRDDITPEYSEAVDKWIRAFAGPHYQLVCDYTANYYFFKHLIPGLSLVGPKGIGKGLYTSGLAESCSNKSFSDGNRLLETFQSDTMVRSPLVVFNEGIPLRQQHSFADRVRRLITADQETVNVKHQALLTVKFPFRILLTANSPGMVLALTSGVYGQDLEALGDRIIHLDLDDGGSKYLKAHGNYTLTQSWVGDESDHTVAKHFLWLYQQKLKTLAGAAPPVDRFLMPGNLLTSSIIHQIKTHDPKTTEALGLVCAFVNQPGAQDNADRGFLIEGGKIYVSFGDLAKFAETHHQEKARDFTATKLGVALAPVKGEIKKHRTVKGLVRFHEIDAKALLEEAQIGWHHSRIQDALGQGEDHDE